MFNAFMILLILAVWIAGLAVVSVWLREFLYLWKIDRSWKKKGGKK